MEPFCGQQEHALLEPKTTTCAAVALRPDCSAALRAPTSMGSPSGVPVPCSATLCIAIGDKAAFSKQLATKTWTSPTLGSHQSFPFMTILQWI